MALQNGAFDDIDVKRISEAEASFEEFMSVRGKSVLAKILDDKIINDELVEMLKDAVSQWKKTFA